MLWRCAVSVWSGALPRPFAAPATLLRALSTAPKSSVPQASPPRPSPGAAAPVVVPARGRNGRAREGVPRAPSPPRRPVGPAPIPELLPSVLPVSHADAKQELVEFGQVQGPVGDGAVERVLGIMRRRRDDVVRVGALCAAVRKPARGLPPLKGEVCGMLQKGIACW